MMAEGCWRMDDNDHDGGRERTESSRAWRWYLTDWSGRASERLIILVWAGAVGMIRDGRGGRDRPARCIMPGMGRSISTHAYTVLQTLIQ